MVQFVKDHKLLTILVGTVILILLMMILSEMFKKENGSREKEQLGAGGIDVGAIPTYPVLVDAMDNVTKDVYGATYNELMENLASERFKLPGTNITFNRYEVSNSVDLIVLTKLAFIKNPYVYTDKYPLPLSSSNVNKSDAIKQLPDGVVIDLSLMSQDYNNTSIFVDPSNPFIYKVTGYANEEYFEETVELRDLYTYSIPN